MLAKEAQRLPNKFMKLSFVSIIYAGVLSLLNFQQLLGPKLSNFSQFSLIFRDENFLGDFSEIWLTFSQPPNTISVVTKSFHASRNAANPKLRWERIKDFMKFITNDRKLSLIDRFPFEYSKHFSFYDESERSNRATKEHHFKCKWISTTYQAQAGWRGWKKEIITARGIILQETESARNTEKAHCLSMHRMGGRDALCI